VRSNGNVYLINKGVGCLSLWRYEGKRVLIDSPGLFLGVGSKLLIPDANQECRIWNSTLVDSGRSSTMSGITTTNLDRSVSQSADEFSFFDSKLRATAYIDTSDGLVFYLWSGEPVAFLNEDSIYGFNGKHLGWFKDGLIYDHDGNIVAAPASAFMNSNVITPIRSLKSLKPLKGLRELKPLKPMFGTSWSTLPARAFFLLGVE
jgi:hypothetical protein